MKIRRFGALASAAALVGALAACSSGGGGAASGQSTAVPKGKVTINWSASPIVGTGANDVRTVLIKEFEKKFPNITVKLTSAPTNSDTYRGTLTTQISGGAATPDVYMGDVIWPAQFAKAGLALPLSKYLPKSYWSTFAPGLTDGATYNGQTYAAPLFTDESFLYYRKDLLTKYHLPVPTSWEQVESESKTLKKAGAVKDGFVWQGNSYEGLTCDGVEFLGDAGGSVLAKDGKKAAIDSAAGKKAVSFLRGLITSGASPSSVSTFTEQESMTDFANGNAAFLRNWSYAYSASNDKSQSKIVGKAGIAVLPTFSGQSGAGYSAAGGWNLYINPHSKQLGADLAFIKFMTGTDAQTILATRYSEIPTNQAVRTSPSVTSANPVMALIGKTKLISRPSNTPAYPDVSKAVYTNINAALTGSKSTDAALSAAQQQINSALSGGGL
jgi:multiple sugar transport system substrate-binding protein